MATTALAAIKERLESSTLLTSLRIPGQDVFLQKAPSNDVTLGVSLVLDHRGEIWDRITESRQKKLSFGILAFFSSLATLDSQVVPEIEDLIDDAEAWITIDGHDSYNLEILSVRLGLEEHCDKQGNDIYVADIDCQLEYQRVRKNSTDAFPD